MSETTHTAWLISANGGIPQCLKSYRTITVSRAGLDPNSPKVIHVALPTSVRNNISDFASLKSDDGTDTTHSRDPSLAAKGKQKKKKHHTRGLKRSLSRARKEIRSLKSQLKQKDTIIENLRKDVDYFESILSNIQDTLSFNKAQQDEPDSPLATSLELPINPLKRSASDAFPEEYNATDKVQRLSECSEDSEEYSSILDDEEEAYSWMPQSPCITSAIDPDSIELLFNFHEADLQLAQEDSSESILEVPESAMSVAPVISGVCLHVQCF